MELSILIPARNEQFLVNTIEDILKHSEAETEIIVGLDGEWADPGIPQNDRVIVVYYPYSIGQRAMTNQLCKLASGKYVMKLDAHCSLDQGFDRKMIEAFQEVGDNVTMVPTMRNLHAYDWVCPDGHRSYQDKGSKCTGCGAEMKMDIVWNAKKRPESRSFLFDSEPHFKYFNEFTKRKEYTGDITETMSIQGSCFMLTRELYWKLNICDESFGNWGNQGIEVACKTWLSGGRVLCNHKTWYAHLFRTKPGVFGFPYHNPESKIRETKSKIREAVFTGKLPHQIYPVSWLVEKFWPVPGWTENDLERVKQGTL